MMRECLTCGLVYAETSGYEHSASWCSRECFETTWCEECLRFERQGEQPRRDRAPLVGKVHRRMLACGRLLASPWRRIGNALAAPWERAGLRLETWAKARAVAKLREQRRAARALIAGASVR